MIPECRIEQNYDIEDQAIGRAIRRIFKMCKGAMLTDKLRLAVGSEIRHAVQHVEYKGGDHELVQDLLTRLNIT